MAYLQARWQISVMSAPENPLVCFTSRSSCTAGHSHVSTSKGIRVSVRISCRSCHVRMQALPCHALLWPTGLKLRPAGLLPGQQGCLLASKRPHLDIGGDRALAGHRAEDLAPAALVRQRDVDELVQPARPQQGWVDDVRPATTFRAKSKAKRSSARHGHSAPAAAYVQRQSPQPGSSTGLSNAVSQI